MDFLVTFLRIMSSSYVEQDISHGIITPILTYDGSGGKMMQKIKFLIVGFTVVGLLLTGCGTSSQDNAGEPKKEEKADQKNEADSGKSNGSSTDNGGTAKDETGSAQDEAGSNKEENDVETAADVIRTPEQNLQFKVEGQTKEQTAFLKNSENQNYSMYVLPEYELNGEEPGKDVLTLKNNEELFMRIEVLPQDVNWTELEQNSDEILKAIDDKINPVSDNELNVPNGIVKEVLSGDNIVTSVLLKDKETPVRLTIFAKKDNNPRNAFIEMGKTIMKTKK
jgi:hypothetical protein